MERAHLGPAEGRLVVADPGGGRAIAYDRARLGQGGVGEEAEGEDALSPSFSTRAARAATAAVKAGAGARRV
jgi:hypothetical protein